MKTPFLYLWNRARSQFSVRRGQGGETFKWDIFLSHAGEDNEEAARIAKWLKDEFHKRGRDLNVFNTSEPESRFVSDWVGTVSARWRPRELRGSALEYLTDSDELKEYLASNMIQSRAYLLLITARSLAKNSEWIEFEIRAAYHLVQERDLPFFPCASGVTPIDFAKLPLEAQRFVHADVSTNTGLVELAAALRKVFRRRPS